MVCNNCVQHFRELTIYSTNDIGYNCFFYCGYLNQISSKMLILAQSCWRTFGKESFNHKSLILFPQNCKIHKSLFTS